MKTENVEKLVCSVCENEVKEQVEYDKPTWFGEYGGDKLLRVICRECYDKGKRLK